MSPLFSKNEVFLDSNVFSEHKHARHARENNLAMLLKVLSHSRCHFKSINQPLRQHSVFEMLLENTAILLQIKYP